MNVALCGCTSTRRKSNRSEAKGGWCQRVAVEPGCCGCRAAPRELGTVRYWYDKTATRWSNSKRRKCITSSGVGEIRTHGTLAGSAVFKTAAFNHSATTPEAIKL